MCDYLPDCALRASACKSHSWNLYAETESLKPASRSLACSRLCDAQGASSKWQVKPSETRSFQGVEFAEVRDLTHQTFRIPGALETASFHLQRQDPSAIHREAEAHSQSLEDGAPSERARVSNYQRSLYCSERDLRPSRFYSPNFWRPAFGLGLEHRHVPTFRDWHSSAHTTLAGGMSACLRLPGFSSMAS